MALLQVVDANRMATTSYALNFRVNRKEEHVCEVTLTDDDMMKFRRVSIAHRSPMMLTLVVVSL